MPDPPPENPLVSFHQRFSSPSTPGGQHLENHDEATLFPLPIESLSLCAYADKRFMRHREYWRSFLKILLPSLLSRENGEVEEMIDHSTLKDWTELIEANQPDQDVGGLLRHISAVLSLQLGLPAELGFAAFLDCELPTRMHWVPGAVQKDIDDDDFVNWFAKVALFQSNPEFSQQVELWRELVDSLPLEHLADVS